MNERLTLVEQSKLGLVSSSFVAAGLPSVIPD